MKYFEYELYKKIFLAASIALITSIAPNDLKALPNTLDSAIVIAISHEEGLSIKNAIIISEATELKGMNSECKWIKEHYVNYKLKMQTLNIVDDKPYDIITILQADGKELKIYFNIESFYGKF
jgi:hypothetical protein